MIVLGITGGIGSGKSYIAKKFGKLGINGIDTDCISKEIYLNGKSCYRELVNYFGEEILSENGEISRQKLSEIIFSNDEKREVLNKITHKYILDECREFLSKREEAGDKIAYVEAPLLYESGFDKECDFVCAVIADNNARIHRIVKRDGITEEEAQLKINKQKSNDFFIKNADFIIENGLHQELDCAVQSVYNKLLDRIGK